MSLASVARYRDYVIRHKRGLPQREPVLRLNMRSPLDCNIWLRTFGTDFNVFSEVFHQQVYEIAASKCSHCKNIIDLGANIGLATLFFAGRYPDCNIFSVEPDPSNYEVMQKNLSKLSVAGRCRHVRGAVWGRKSQLVVEAPVGGEDQYFGFLVRETSEGETSSVVAMTMAEIISQSGFKNVDLLKIDIEGAETELFRSDSIWLNQVRAIAIEFHGNSRIVSGFDRVMTEFGFTIDDSSSHTVTAIRRNVGDRGAYAQTPTPE